ncbi:hypothetical protein [Nocardia spumae]|uniref:hypothetical protein n=1 Tax=Nocardia spumae TaxID=2887190 RepID=UPI001D137DB2|nr:hypothetical protein [Nocardia spumae]
MTRRDPNREVTYQSNLHDALVLLLDSEAIQDSPAAPTLIEMRLEIEEDFFRDEQAANAFRRMALPASGPLAEMRGVESRLLGRCLRAAMESAMAEGEAH